MYTIMLVDDEDEVREGMKRKTDWQACGFTLIGDYDNGRDALAAIEVHPPDLLVTDICMPFMDGLELARAALARYRHMRVVIITGYEEFDYAKQAIQLQVNEYLLKPINARELTEFLHKMKQELDHIEQQKKDISRLRIQLNESFPLLRERFLERLANVRMNPAYIQEKLRYFQILLQGPAYIAMVCDIELNDAGTEEAAADNELLRFAAFNIMQEQLEKEAGGVVFRTREEKIGAILMGKAADLELSAQMLAEQVRSSLARYLKLSVTIGIGKGYDELTDISQSFQAALSALDYRFLIGKPQVIAIQDIAYGQGLDQARFRLWEQQWLAGMKSGKTHVVSEVLQPWFAELKSCSPSMEECRHTIYPMLASLISFVAEIGYDLHDLLQEDPFMQVQQLRSFDQMATWLERLCHRVIHQLSDQRVSIAEEQIRQAEDFIRQNYADENFSLQQVCNHIFMSISYFSANFKQYTGETFVEYISRIRMEKAKELLQLTPLKTYEIAARVGYGDPQYFSVIFKRHTGRTPKEFRLTGRGSPPS